MPAPANPSPATETSMQPTKDGNLKKVGLLAVVLLAGGALFWAFSDRLSLDYLAQQEETLRSYRLNYPIITALVAVAIYVGVAGFSLPGAAVLTLAYGWYFGFWVGLLVVSFGSTGGATMAFLITRFILQDMVQRRFSKKLQTINDAFEREGAFYLFTLRLIPAVPFFVINAVMGLTKIRASTFWWVSQLGMLPGTAAYVYAGSTVPSLKQLAEDGVGTVLSWQLILAFVILGILPLTIKRVVMFFSKTTLHEQQQDKNLSENQENV